MLLLAIALGTGAIFASFIIARGIQASTEQSFARMGADLIVVPAEAMVNITSALLTVQPTDATFDDRVLEAIVHLDGVAQAAPQTIYHVPIMAGMPGHQVNLIVFDPKRDLTVMPWICQRIPRALQVGDLLSGFRRPESVGVEIEPCNIPEIVYGKLGRSGVGPFDESLFTTYETVASMAEKLRSSSTRISFFGNKRFSAVLVRLAFGATPEQVRFAIARLPGVKVITAPTIVTSTRQTITALLNGIAALTLFLLVGSLILVSLLFSAIITERRREIGLLRAIGSRRSDIVKMLITEALLTTGIGGLCGILFGGALLLAFQRSLVYYFETLHVDFVWSSCPEIISAGFVCAITAALFGLVGVAVPAMKVSGAEPYLLIQGEGG